MIPPTDRNASIDRQLIEKEIRYQITQQDPTAQDVSLDVYRDGYVAISYESEMVGKEPFSDYLSRLNIKAKPGEIHERGSRMIYHGDHRFVQIGRA